MRKRCLTLALLCLACALPPIQGASHAVGDSPVYVLLWFDTEDYLLPEADDAALRLCEFLSEQQVRATFKLVGEKARVLEQRGRTDVLDALAKHEIGYHTDFHSVQPSPAMYLSQLGWSEGVEEFDRREGQGLKDLKRITGQSPSCYGQPGSSWGPQQYGALRKWGVPVYLDAGEHISVNGEPFWYGGILTIFNIKHTLRTGLSSPEDLSQAKSEFRSAYDELMQAGGGVVSIYYHPCEFVHEEFWDAVNFRGGANPTRSEWKIPPMKSSTATETAFRNFEAYVHSIKAYPNVRFITAGQALELFPDRAKGHSFRTEDLLALARGLSAHGVTFQRIGEMTVSASEQMLLLSQFVHDRLTGKKPPGILLEGTPTGPVRLAPAHNRVVVSLDQVERTLEDVIGYLVSHGRIPDAVWLGSSAVSPESFLLSLARIAIGLSSGNSPSGTVTFEPAGLPAAQYVRNNRDLWGWIIFPPGFEAPEMMKLAKRQAWTLKPAILARHK